jgi:hypothetical protein
MKCCSAGLIDLRQVREFDGNESRHYSPGADSHHRKTLTQFHTKIAQKAGEISNRETGFLSPAVFEEAKLVDFRLFPSKKIWPGKVQIGVLYL